jgi:hypothetical protein
MTNLTDADLDGLPSYVGDLTQHEYEALIAEVRRHRAKPQVNREAVATTIARMNMPLDYDDSLEIADAILALSPAPASGCGWRSIESAPKDAVLLLYGTLLGGSPEHPRQPIRAVGYWDEIDEAWALSDTTWEGPFMNPTHWQRPPAPPTQGQDQ